MTSNKNTWAVLQAATTALALVVLLTGCALAPILERDPPEPFTLVVLPDTQHYSRSFPGIFKGQTQWIRDNVEALNIVGVAHEGDLVHVNDSAVEWEVARKSMGLLDGSVPYFLCVGNHDMQRIGPQKLRDTRMFDTAFPLDKFENEKEFGGCYEGSLANAYYYLEAGGMNFLVVSLECAPRDEVLEWANQIVSSHKNRRTIVVTHIYTYIDDTRVSVGDQWYPKNYGNDGDQMWEKFVRKHENIFLVLSGHCLMDGLGRLVSTGDNGNEVHQILANYQVQKNGGNGMLRIMTFHPAENEIRVQTYSPTLDEYKTDPDNQFTLSYEMK